MIASVAITAVAFYGAGEILAAMQDSLLEGVYSCGEAVAEYPTVSAATAAGVHAGAGAVAGGLSSAINHSNVGLGMLTGAISAGVAKFAGSFIENEAWGYQFAGRAAIGATTGGITSAIYGHNFWKGVARGGVISTAAFLFNDLCHDARMRMAVSGGAAAVGAVTTVGGLATSVLSIFEGPLSIAHLPAGIIITATGAFMTYESLKEFNDAHDDAHKYCPQEEVDKSDNIEQ